MPLQSQPVPVRVHVTGGARDDTVAVAVEAPLQVRVCGEPFAVVMRTPGEDEALAAGFVFAEGVVNGPEDIIDLAAFPDDPALGNVVNVVLAPPAAVRSAARLAERRRTVTSAACGLCGRVRVDSLVHDAPPLPIRWQVAGSVLVELPAALRGRQPVFAETGGLHAAVLFERGGRVRASAEDVGRHNAVDKLVGRALLSASLPLDEMGLVVSGRTSFEIVQKAFLAGIPLVAAISAPSSLAVEYAQATGITLVGFAREGRFTVFSHPARIG